MFFARLQISRVSCVSVRILRSDVQMYESILSSVCLSFIGSNKKRMHTLMWHDMPIVVSLSVYYINLLFVTDSIERELLLRDYYGFGQMYI